jgi:hypothetical protein
MTDKDWQANLSKLAHPTFKVMVKIIVRNFGNVTPDLGATTITILTLRLMTFSIITLRMTQSV